MRSPDLLNGLSELRAARRAQNGLFRTVFLFSALVNLLMLTGPIYMLQVYDRVLGSHSEATLVALTGLMIVMFLAMGLLDHARGRIAARIGARFQDQLDGRVFAASSRLAAALPGDPVAQTAQRDLEAIQRLLISPLLMALFDLPWVPLFLLAIFLFHPLAGALALAGGVVLVIITLLNQSMTRHPVARATVTSQAAERLADQIRAEAETIRSLGMQQAAFARWSAARDAQMGAALAASDATGGFTALTKTIRLFLQSAMLGLGAWLVLRGEMTPGAMIAGSILLGRALAPVEGAIGQWGLVVRAQEAHQRLAWLLGRVPAPQPQTALPRPAARLQVTNLLAAPPGESTAVLRGISFQLNPGQALGVIGPSGAGKSSLARAITGLWPVGSGRIALDDAPIAQYDSDALGGYIGYLPQRIALFDGTIAENIARLALAPDAEAVVTAARRANAHEMILQFPQGYDTKLTATGNRLSGGQIQRIGLARALYGDPVLLVLDEPNSNLDNEGSLALNQAIRSHKASGGAVIIMAHRPAAIQECDLILVLENGARTAFGPRDEVLRAQVRNHSDIRRAGPGGAA